MAATKPKCCSECGQWIKENELTATQRRDIKKAASAINSAFSWDETREGKEYWSDLYNRLWAISEGKPL
jgi:hypothetical protein